MIGTPVIVLRDLTKVYGAGDDDRARAPRRQPRHRGGRVRRDHGRVGKREEHADAHHRLPRRRHGGSLPARRRRRRHPRLRTRCRCCATARSASSSRASTSSRVRRPSRTSSCRWSTPTSRRPSGRERAMAALAAVGLDGRADAMPEPALGRPTATGRDRPGDRHRSRDHPRRRAHRRARQRVDRRGARPLRAGSTAKAAP